MFYSVFRNITLAAVCASAVVSLSSAEIRLHGSSTVGKGIVVPNQAQIEKDGGDKLAIVTNGSGNHAMPTEEAAYRNVVTLHSKWPTFSC